MGNLYSKKHQQHQQSAVIAKCSSPAYCVKSIGSRHILLAGGGGAAKTGVTNNIETYLLSYDRLLARDGLGGPGGPGVGPVSGSGPGPGPTANEIHLKAHLADSIKTDPHATMNMDLIGLGAPEYGRYLLAAGHDQYCDIYESKGFGLSGSGPEGGKENDRRHRRLLSFNFEQIARLQTDRKPKGPYQKAVRFDRSVPGQPRTMVTGGADGCIRVWSVEVICRKNSSKQPSSQEPIFEMPGAHNGDVDDLDISRDGRTLISIGHDAKVYLWSLDDGKKLLELPELQEIGNQFRVRSIRFTTLGSSNVIFVAAYNQIRRSSRSVSHIALWAFNRDRCVCKPIIVREACRETISTLAVSECGNFTAIGTLSGSVAIFDTHEMRLLYMARETHGIFVTGVEFLPHRTVDFAPLRSQSSSSSSQLHSRDNSLSGSGSSGTSSGPSMSRQRAQYPGVVSEYRCAVISLSADQTVQFHPLPFTQSSSITLFMLKLSLISAFIYYLIWYLCNSH